MEVSTPNQDIVVSWIYTWSRQREMSINEQRVVLRILEFCQKEIKGIRISENLRQIEHTLFDVKLTMPISDAFFSDYKPADVKEALRTLSHRSFEYCDNKNDEWWMCDFIESPEVQFRSGKMTFRVDNKLWDIFLNFSKGYREFELNKALQLPTSYALRFYMLMSGQKNAFEFTIQKLKEWLGIPEDMYKTSTGKDRIDNIEARILKPTKEILDNSCPYSFDYIKKKENPDNKTSKVIGFVLIPIYQPKYRDTKLEKNGLIAQLSGRLIINSLVYDYFQNVLGFTSKEINGNKQTIVEAQETIPDLLNELGLLAGKSRDKNNPKGWIIQALKGMTYNAKSGKR